MWVNDLALRSGPPWRRVRPVEVFRPLRLAASFYQITISVPNKSAMQIRIARAFVLRLAQRCVLFAIWLRGLPPPPKLSSPSRRIGLRKFCVKFLDPRRGLWRKVATTKVVRRGGYCSWQHARAHQTLIVGRRASRPWLNSARARDTVSRRVVTYKANSNSAYGCAPNVITRRIYL